MLDKIDLLLKNYIEEAGVDRRVVRNLTNRQPTPVMPANPLAAPGAVKPAPMATSTAAARGLANPNPIIDVPNSNSNPKPNSPLVDGSFVKNTMPPPRSMPDQGPIADKIPIPKQGPVQSGPASGGPASGGPGLGAALGLGGLGLAGLGSAGIAALLGEEDPSIQDQLESEFK